MRLEPANMVQLPQPIYTNFMSACPVALAAEPAQGSST